MGKVKDWMMDLEASMIGNVSETEKWRVTEPTTPKGLKYDNEKPRMDLLDAHALEGLSKVLTFGANKYAANNWREGIQYSRIIGAIYRHLSAIQRGEDTDPESGLPHIDHIGCEWMFLSNFMKTRLDLDDRWVAKERHQQVSNQRYDQDHQNETFHVLK